MPTSAYIYDAIRTPRGRGRANGSLHTVKPVDLMVGLLEELKCRHPGLDYGRVADLVLGVVTPIGEQGGDIARTAVLKAGLPLSIPGLQVNRFCGSGLEAVNIAAQKIASGWESLVLAGGVESMSRVAMSSDGAAWAMDPETAYGAYFVPQGVSADLIATLEEFDRFELDDWAVRSQRRAAAAQNEGRFGRSLVPVRDHNGTVLLDRDEHVRPEATPESLAALPAAFAKLGDLGGFDSVALQKYHWLERIEHVHTAGNSSGIVDGASLVLVGDEQIGTEMGLEPRARILATALAGTDPTIMLTGPAPASTLALQRAGLRIDDIDLIEVNEAFAGIVLRFIRDLGADPDRINVNGGAIAMGHPLGATGGMLLGTLLDELERTGGRYGLVTLCIAAGMGVATVVERVGA